METQILDEFKHYLPNDLIEKLLKNSKIVGECLVWTGAIAHNGYGRTTFNYQSMEVHRLVGRFLFGTSTRGNEVCHKCNNKACFRPSHIYMGTRKTNAMDDFLSNSRILKGANEFNRRKTHCMNNHEFNKENTGINKNGTRYCRECKRLKSIKNRENIKNLIVEACKNK